ncbi:ATP-binding protein [Streptomyces cavernae]|uniref:ATP-binding protein n=1 Tax=Streptomyces cavernae TaxID=2259034 RepID=UPI000FEBDF1E|nr:ATP-binding protein [Streptomyces cavernae]
MTTHLADQERTRRRALGTANEPRCLRGTETARKICIERRLDPDSGGLSEADAAWPQRLRRILRASLTHWGRPDLVETAELLLSELATNALHYGTGPDIGVRFSLQGDHLKIDVNDGSPLRPEPRCAGPDDESGRGLLLVESLADAWGVSDDGTTTWFTLPLTEGPSDMEPAAATAPVVREIPLDLPADPSATGLARVQGRTRLTMLRWPGNQHLAVDVLHVLINNAVQHALTPEKEGQRFGARLSITQANELLIDVTDPNPTFPDFDEAIAGELGRGLWAIARQGVDITWSVNSDFDGKTVRATLRPGPVDL